MLRIAIQAKGRMSQECIELLHSVGVKLTIRETNPVLVRSSNFPAEVLFIEKDRIPEFLSNNVADVGIMGEYMAKAHGTPDELIIKRLGFDKSTLSLAVPREIKYKGIEWFIGKSVATPYPDLLTKYFKSRNIKAQIRMMREYVYMAPKVGMADAICDRVHSGTTLISENLKEVETVMHSEAVLVVSPNLTPQKQMILDEFILRIDSVQNAMGKKLITMNVPKKNIEYVNEIMLSLKKPTIIPLQGDEWVSLSTVIDERRLWDIVEKLKLCGVEDIVVRSIEKII